ncbi:MAG: protein translocase subunit SecF [Chloroflexi bacterium]|nr:protein translocase subunit SecF [Chloroflexota bacterium]
MIDFVGKRFVYLYVSAAMLVLSIAAIATGGLKPGIEFSSGSTLTIAFKEPVSEADLRAKLAALGHEDATIQITSLTGYVLKGGNLSEDKATALTQALREKFGPPALFAFNTGEGSSLAYHIVFAHPVDKSDLQPAIDSAGVAGQTTDPAPYEAFLLRTESIDRGTTVDASGKPLSSEFEEFESALKDKFGSLGTFDFYTVSPTIASDIVRNAGIAVVLASIAILLYITFAFRRMPNPFRWGVCAVIALVHDTLFVIGVFAVLGLTLGIQVNAMFISAVLTVVGFSVHDTIVVFDRIRENNRLGISKDFPTTVDYSLNQTLGRSLATSLTVVFVLLALLLLGGVTTRDFVLTMLIGIVAGTYSSIFVASQLLVVWHNREWKRLIPFVAG